MKVVGESPSRAIQIIYKQAISSVQIMKTIHGHEVIEFINDANPLIEKAKLNALIAKKFGDARFYTCSEDDLTAKELIAFLERKDKLFYEDGKVKIKTENVCSDDD